MQRVPRTWGTIGKNIDRNTIFKLKNVDLTEKDKECSYNSRKEFSWPQFFGFATDEITKRKQTP